MFYLFFILPLAGIVYVYIKYPLLIAFYAFFKRKKIDKDENYIPEVTMIIPAFNEEKFIGKKLINSLNLNYPKEKLKIIVGDDGSTDNTFSIASSYKKFGIKVFSFKNRRGKISVMNDLAEKSRSEIIIFSDANTFYEKNSLLKLVRNFNDPEVGVVCGRLTLEKGNYSSVTKPELIYWDYEHFLKLMETRSGSTVGVVGSIYGVRRNLLEKYHIDTILDDLEIGISVLKKGYRIVYEQEAEAKETMVSSTINEFNRKVRLVSGGFKSVYRNRDIFYKNHDLSFRLLSHKLLRWLIPFNLIFVFLYSIFTIKRSKKIFIYQLLFYISPVIEILINSLRQFFYGKRDIKVKLTYIPFYFIMINLAAIIGFFNFIFDRQSVKWKMTRDD